jgi:flavodoxin I
MNILVVYDSYFGNTEKIAQEIGKSFGDDVPVKRPADVDMGSLTSLDLLVVGAPTRAFRPSDAIKAFLKEIPNDSLKDVNVASFDTRIEPEDIGNPILKFMANTFGYAAEPIAKGLVRKGGVQVGEPIGFVVMDSEGPLREGELERAADWVETLLD